MRSKRLRLILFFAAFCAALSFARTTPQQADLIVVFKKDHLLKLYSQRQVIRTYKVALGTGGLAPKEKEGDGRVPEGRYMIDRKNAASHYHKALHISYPNVEDRARAAKLHAAPGGDIMIHGLMNGLGFIGAGHRSLDWTKGCVAVTDEEIDEMFNLVPVGTPVEIRP